MALFKDTARTAAVQEPPIATELRCLFAALEDAPLLKALAGPMRPGPRGHSVRVLWRCLVAKYHLGLPSTDALIRELHNNPYVAAACGIPSPDKIPHKSTFSRFFARMASYKVRHLVKDVSRSLVRSAYSVFPAFGKRVAIDSTTLKARSNGGKRKHADKDAAWSVKQNTHGKNEYTFGYKLHLLADCEYEFPISANISPGNVHDSQRASNVLSEARFTYPRFKPAFVMADKGYSGQPLFHLIRRQYKADPIIELNPQHKRLAKREERLSVKTPEWKALYSQRPAVERVFARLKGQRSLNHITVRRLAKVTVHCYVSLIALQVHRLQTLKQQCACLTV